MQNLGLEKINYVAVGESVYRAVLANGLQVYLLPKNDFNETYGIISINFGSVDTKVVSREQSKSITTQQESLIFWNINYLREKTGKICCRNLLNSGQRATLLQALHGRAICFLRQTV